MSAQRLHPWTIVASTYRVDDRYLRLRVDTVRLPDGSIVEGYYVRETHGFTVVAALTPEREIVLVRQYKHGAAAIVDELPAGAIEPGESPADCAVRELREETGYAGDPPRLIRTLYADPTSSNGMFHLYLIENARPAFAQSLDPTEAIVVETASLSAFAAMLRDGRIASGSQVACGYLLLDALGPSASSQA